MLHKFEGREVIGTKIALTNAGDGLSQAMAIEPVELRSGTKVFLLMEAEVGKITFDPVKDSDVFVRVQQLKAGTATLVDKEFAGNLLEEQRARIEAAKGVQRLDFTGEDEGTGDGNDE